MNPRLVDIPVLETERLILRAPCAADFPVLEPFIRSDRAAFIGGGADKDQGHAWRILAILAGHWHLRGYGTYVAERKDTGAPVGSMGPWHPEGWPEQELGWTIWSDAVEGTGMAFEAMTRIQRHVYADLGWPTAVSYIDVNNPRSEALAQRLGCTIDPDAVTPHPDEPVRAWRHPSPAEFLA